MVDRASDLPRRSKFSPCSEGAARYRVASGFTFVRGSGVPSQHRPRRGLRPSVRPKRTSSGRWNDDLGPRRNPDLAPALQPVGEPNRAGEGDERAEHDEAEGAREMAEDGAERMTEEIADGDEACCPQSGRQKIQSQESLPADGTHPHRERRYIADPVDEPEGQYKAGIITFEPTQCVVAAVSPPRETVQNLQPEMAADPEIRLVSSEAPEPSGHEQQQGVEETLRGREAGEQNDRLAFEEGPDKRP